MPAATAEAPSQGLEGNASFTHTEVRTIDDYPMFAVEVPQPTVLRKGKARAQPKTA